MSPPTNVCLPVRAPFSPLDSPQTKFVKVWLQNVRAKTKHPNDPERTPRAKAGPPSRGSFDTELVEEGVRDGTDDDDELGFLASMTKKTIVLRSGSPSRETPKLSRPPTEPSLSSLSSEVSSTRSRSPQKRPVDLRTLLGVIRATFSTADESLPSDVHDLFSDLDNIFQGCETIPEQLKVGRFRRCCRSFTY
jgi:hypothetical protein